MKNPMRVYYDEEGDFLEISIGNPSECTALEIEPGVFVRQDDATKKIKSIGIMNFKKRKETELPIEISFSM